MTYRCLQFFFAAMFFVVVTSRAADLEDGKIYHVTFTDVEGRQFALGDGHAILLTVATQQTETKAHLVGRNVPDEFVGDPRYRCVTIINFQNRIPSLLHKIITAVVRHRFHAEADAVQPRYTAKKIEHSPRADLYAVADFDGTIPSEIGYRSCVKRSGSFCFRRTRRSRPGVARCAVERRAACRARGRALLISRHGRVDFFRPCINAALEIRYIR